MSARQAQPLCWSSAIWLYRGPVKTGRLSRVIPFEAERTKHIVRRLFSRKNENVYKIAVKSRSINPYDSA